MIPKSIEVASELVFGGAIVLTALYLIARFAYKAKKRKKIKEQQ